MKKLLRKSNAEFWAVNESEARDNIHSFHVANFINIFESPELLGWTISEEELVQS